MRECLFKSYKSWQVWHDKSGQTAANLETVILKTEEE